MLLNNGEPNLAQAESTAGPKETLIKNLIANLFKVLREENWHKKNARDLMIQGVNGVREITWTKPENPAWANNNDDQCASLLLTSLLPIARKQWCSMQAQLDTQGKTVAQWLIESEQIVLSLIEELEKLESLFGPAPEPEDEDLPVGPPPSIGEIMDHTRGDMIGVRIEIGTDLVEPKKPTPFRAAL